MQRLLKELFFFLGDKKARKMGGSVIGTSFPSSSYIAPSNCSAAIWSGDRMNKASCLCVLFLQWHLQACIALSMLLLRRLDLVCNCRNQTAGKKMLTKCMAGVINIVLFLAAWPYLLLLAVLPFTTLMLKERHLLYPASGSPFVDGIRNMGGFGSVPVTKPHFKRNFGRLSWYSKAFHTKHIK